MIPIRKTGYKFCWFQVIFNGGHSVLWSKYLVVISVPFGRSWEFFFPGVVWWEIKLPVVTNKLEQKYDSVYACMYVCVGI